MNLAYNVIFVITAIFIMIYDFKYQKIPISLLVLNYISVCLLTNIYLLIGLSIILILKKLDRPIDILYLSILGYIIIVNQNVYSVISILILLLYIIFSKSTHISLMVPLELALLYQLFILTAY